MNFSELCKETATLDRAGFKKKYPTPALVIAAPNSPTRARSARKGDDLEDIYGLTDSYALDKIRQQSPSRIEAASRVFFLPDRPVSAEQPLSLGRADDSDIQLEVSTVSVLHAFFARAKEGWTVTDAQSTNGTEVNGQRLEGDASALLKDGDSIRLGPETVAVFLTPEALFDRVAAFRAKL